MKTRAILALLLLAVLTAGIALSQAVNATLVGTITDSSGAVVVNAKVIVTETNTGVGRQTSSNESGNYTFPNLPPGTTRAFQPHAEFFNSQGSLTTQVNGVAREGNNVQFEGVDNNHRTGLLTVLIPPIEALQTVDVTTSNYEAELGRAGGAVTNIILKSGSNDLHGGVYWFHSDSALGARETFQPSKP